MAVRLGDGCRRVPDAVSPLRAKGRSGVVLPTAEITEICRRYQVKELSVFGSAARGGLGPESDIDLLVELEPAAKLGLLKYSSLMRELSTVLGRKVDLVGKAGLKPLVRPEVLAEARVIHAA